MWYGMPLQFAAKIGLYDQITDDSPLPFPGIYDKPDDGSGRSGHHAMYIAGVGVFPIGEDIVIDMETAKTYDPKKNPGEYKDSKTKESALDWVNDHFRKHLEKEEKSKMDKIPIEDRGAYDTWFLDWKSKILIKQMGELGKKYELQPWAQKFVYYYHNVCKVVGVIPGKTHYAKIQVGSDSKNIFYLPTKLVPRDLKGVKVRHKDHWSEPVKISVKKDDQGDQVVLKKKDDQVVLKQDYGTKLKTKLVSQGDWDKKHHDNSVTRKRYVQVVNSWGTQWGHKGQVWISFDDWYDSWIVTDAVYGVGLIGFAEVTRPVEEEEEEEEEEPDYDEDSEEEDEDE